MFECLGSEQLLAHDQYTAMSLDELNFTCDDHAPYL